MSEVQESEQNSQNLQNSQVNDNTESQIQQQENQNSQNLQNSQVNDNTESQIQQQDNQNENEQKQSNIQDSQVNSSKEDQVQNDSKVTGNQSQNQSQEQYNTKSQDDQSSLPNSSAEYTINYKALSVNICQNLQETLSALQSNIKNHLQGLELERTKFNEEGNFTVQKMDLQEMDYKSRLENVKKPFGFEISVKGLFSVKENDENLNDRPKIITFQYDDKEISKIDKIDDGFLEVLIGEKNFIEGSIRYTDEYDSEEYDTFQLSIQEILQKIKPHSILEYQAFLNKNIQVYLNLKIFQTGVGAKSWLSGYKRKQEQRQKWEKHTKLQKQILEQIDQDDKESEITTTEQEIKSQQDINQNDMQKSQRAKKNIEMTQSIIQELRQLQDPDSENEKDDMKNKVQKEYDTYKEDFEKDVNQEPENNQGNNQENNQENKQDQDNKQDQENNQKNQQDQENNSDQKSQSQINSQNQENQDDQDQQSMSQSKSIVQGNMDMTQDPQDMEQSQQSGFNEQQVNKDKVYKEDEYFKNKGLLFTMKRLENVTASQDQNTIGFTINIMDANDILLDLSGEEINLEGNETLVDDVENCVDWQQELKINIDCEQLRQKYFDKLQELCLLINISNNNEDYGAVMHQIFNNKTGLINLGDMQDELESKEKLYYNISLFDL